MCMKRKTGKKNKVASKLGSIKKLGLKTKIVLNIAAILAVSFILLGVYGYTEFNRIVADAAQTQLIYKTDYMKEKVIRFFDTRTDILNEHTSTAANVFYDDATGMDKAALGEYLESIFVRVQSEVDAVDIYMGFPDGSAVCGSGWQPAPEDNWIATERSWYKSALGNIKVNYTDVYVDADTKQPVVTLSKSVRNNAGDILGVMALDISLAQLRGLFDSETIGTTGFEFLVDTKGRYVCHKDYAYVEEIEQAATLYDMAEASAILEGSRVIDDGQNLYYAKPIPNTKFYTVSCMPKSDYSNTLMALLLRLSTVLLVILVLVTAIMVVVVTRVTRDIGKIGEVMNAVATGNLSSEVVGVKRHDELGVLAAKVNETIQYLKNTVHTLQTSAAVVSKSSVSLLDLSEESAKTMVQIAESNTSLANEFATMKVDLEKTCAAVEEIDRLLKSAVKETDSMQVLLDKTVELAVEGSKSVDAAIKTAVDTSVEATNKVGVLSEALLQSNTEIGQLSKLIKDIADKSNLLALNAGIEAARAGEHGRGFAVVANEMRSLAIGTKESVEKITQVITQTSNQITELFEAANNQKTSMVSVKNVSSDVVLKFKEILDLIKNNKAAVSEVVEQVKALEVQEAQLLAFVNTLQEVNNKVVADVDASAASTEEQSASLEEVSAFAENLRSIAGQLDEQIRQFKTE